MSKSEQTGGGGGSSPRKEPKPKQKRPWRKPRLMLIQMDFTTSGGTMAPRGLEGDHIDPASPGTRYKSS